MSSFYQRKTKGHHSRLFVCFFCRLEKLSVRIRYGWQFIEAWCHWALTNSHAHTEHKTNSKRITIVITPVATEVVQYDTSVHVKKDKRKSRSEKFTVFQSHESRRHATLGIIIVPYSSSLLPLRCQSRKEGRSLGLTFSLKFLSTNLMGMGFFFQNERNTQKVK